MTLLLVSFASLLGVLVGSFLNVVIWRVPRGESIVRPPSACPGCGTAIRPRDNVPVVSWLLLRARCRDCRRPISRRYPMVELATGGLFGVVAARFGLHAELPAYLYLAAVAIALTMIDIDVKRLPDKIVLPSYVVAGVLLGAASLASPHQALRAALGGLAMFTVYFALAFAYPAGMGFGDVKLSGVLGMYTGWLGWDVWGAGLLLGFFTGGFFGIALILAGRGGRKTAVPFGPFMLLGAFLAIFGGHQLVHAYLGATTGS